MSGPLRCYRDALPHPYRAFTPAPMLNPAPGTVILTAWGAVTVAATGGCVPHVSHSARHFPAKAG